MKTIQRVKKKNDTISIMKGLGLIFMVCIHAYSPYPLSKFFLSFDMPMFFIASGYFFKEAYLGDKKTFLLKKVKSLYVPFVKWSVIFVLLHNVFFSIGIINDSYGSKRGLVDHWFTFGDTFKEIADILFRMNCYEGLLGAYWFMRALFVGLVLMCLVSWLVNKFVKNEKYSIIATSVIFLLIAGGLSFFQKRIPLVPIGGFREMMAVFFIGLGYMLAKTKLNIVLQKPVYGYVFFIALVVMDCIHPTSLGFGNIPFLDYCLLPFAAFLGFVFLYHTSKLIDLKTNKLKKFLVYVGENGFNIMTFHMLMFKPASLLKTYIYGLDWKMIGCHPCIWDYNSWFWIVYVVTSLALTLWLCRYVNKVPFLKS